MGIRGLGTIKRNLNRLKGKKIAVFSVGCSPVKPETVDTVVKHNFHGEQLKQVKLFCLRGGFDYNKLGFIDKMLMNLMKRKLERIRPEDRDEEVRGLLEAFKTPVDFTARKNIEPIVNYIKQ